MDVTQAKLLAEQIQIVVDEARALRGYEMIESAFSDAPALLNEHGTSALVRAHQKLLTIATDNMANMMAELVAEHNALVQKIRDLGGTP